MDVSEYVDALAATWSSLGALAGGLTDEEWSRPTGCPGWTVGDLVAHVAALEAFLLGRPEPAHELPTDLPHVRSEFSRFMEAGVDRRRRRTRAEVLAELGDVTAARLAELRAWPPDPERRVPSPFGKQVPARTLLRLRTFDCYAHEQDIRRAVHRPGHLAGAAADVSWRVIREALARSLTGPSVALRFGDHGAVVPDEAAAPVATLTTDWSNGLALACGRADADPGAVVVTGDRPRAAEVLAALAVTP
ncbi:MAG TPA: maleylpyruvate isomerase family mycothiol-dependent enzyme [Mycobacteriales bacterium]|nr:maleylpyruvate isomerase family mycothiol-dependent enzyme [Mycobacteriales bacterium]